MNVAFGLSAIQLALLIGQASGNIFDDQGNIVAGGIEFGAGDLENLQEDFVERERERPPPTFGASSRRCVWRESIGFCSAPATVCLVDPPLTCVNDVITTSTNGCNDGCEFKVFPDDGEVGFCAPAGNPNVYTAADLRTLLDCDSFFGGGPGGFSQECEDATALIYSTHVPAADTDGLYIQEIRDEFRCNRQATQATCLAVEVADCPGGLPQFAKCAGKNVNDPVEERVICCGGGAECIKKNRFYSQCRVPNDIPAGWDGQILDCAFN